MDRQTLLPQNVSLPLQEYNQLYEQAYFNERKRELEKERKVLDDLKQTQEDAMKQKERRLQEARLKDERERRGTVTSHNWLLTSHTVEGTYEPTSSAQDGGFAVFHFNLELRVFEQEWTVVPLVDSQIITDCWAVQRAENKAILAAEETLDSIEWKPVSLSSDAWLHVQELDGAQGRQVLAITKAGLYRVNFSAYIFVHSARSLNSLSLNLVHPITGMNLRLKQDSVRTKVRELSITPASHHSLEEVSDSCDIKIRLPPTKTVEIRWRGVEATTVAGDNDLAEWEDKGGEKVVPEEEALQITAAHDVLHAIMDGVLQSSHTLKYCVDSEQGALTGVRFTVQGAARVTSVTGYGVMNWRASLAEGGTVVDVGFKSSLISDTVIILLNTELELAADTFTTPSVCCEGVLRQTGNLGIVKIANVEVHEQLAKGMARIGVDELPTELKCQTNRPIMFAYRYLSPQSDVQLRVIKHEQVEVLEAVAESAFYEVLMSEGQSMHRLMINMQNSRKQYLEVRGIPSDARIWSLLVNSKPAKPVRGSDGVLLVPLLVGLSGKSNDGAQSTSVEMAYLVQQATLGSNGSKNVAPPGFDIPVSRLHVEVQWPEGYEVKFKSSGQKLAEFSHSLPRPVNHDVGTDIVEYSFDFNKTSATIPKTGVNVKMPRAGQRHRFEQLLVVDGGVHLTAEYRAKVIEQLEQPKGLLNRVRDRFCGHRRPL